jgi:hypothetical protein
VRLLRGHRSGVEAGLVEQAPDDRQHRHAS